MRMKTPQIKPNSAWVEPSGTAPPITTLATPVIHLVMGCDGCISSSIQKKLRVIQVEVHTVVASYSGSPASNEAEGHVAKENKLEAT